MHDSAVARLVRSPACFLERERFPTTLLKVLTNSLQRGWDFSVLGRILIQREIPPDGLEELEGLEACSHLEVVCHGANESFLGIVLRLHTCVVC